MTSRRSAENLEFDVDGTLAAPSRARRRLAAWMSAAGVAQEAQRPMLLVVSELVTNAVTHARSSPRVAAQLRDGLLRLDVHDSSRDPPVIQPRGTGDGGFGMRLVADAVDTWGWTPTPSGKVVWTELYC